MRKSMLFVAAVAALALVSCKSSDKAQAEEGVNEEVEAVEEAVEAVEAVVAEEAEEVAEPAVDTTKDDMSAAALSIFRNCSDAETLSHLSNSLKKKVGNGDVIYPLFGIDMETKMQFSKAAVKNVDTATSTVKVSCPATYFDFDAEKDVEAPCIWTVVLVEEGGSYKVNSVTPKWN